MVNKKSFKPPAKTDEGKEVRQNRGISLTDQQYEEIFSAVLHSQKCSQQSQPETVMKSPSYAKSPGYNVALSPKECASVENSQNGPNTETATETEKHQKEGEKEKNTDSTLNTINTDEFVKNATFSTPTKIVQPKSLKQAWQSLKNKLNESLSESLSESIDQTLVDLWDPANQLSQLPEGLSKRERLQWLQDRRGTGLWVKCDHSDCGKWRWLDTADPVDVPKIWTCNLNPDKAFASCSVPEKPIPLCIEEDMIHNAFTAGSIVWAKMPGYPWWPAMVDDCPDCEQYYWLDNDYDDVPTSYHVVFFDENDVSRRWMQVEDLLSFKHRPELAKLFKIKPYQRKRFEISTKKAREALKLSIKERLQRYSFLALWKGEIPEDSDSCLSDSESEIPSNTQDYDRYVKKRIMRRRRKLAGLPISSRKEKSSNKINSSQSTGKKRARKISTDSEKSVKTTGEVSSSKTNSPKSAERKRERKISTDSEQSVAENDQPVKIPNTKTTGEVSSSKTNSSKSAERKRERKISPENDKPAKVVRRSKSTGEPDRKTESPGKNKQDLNKSLPVNMSNSNIDKDLAVKFYEHCYEMFTQGEDVSKFFNNMFNKDTPKESTNLKRSSLPTQTKDSSSDNSDMEEIFSPEKTPQKRKYTKKDSKAAPVRRSPRLSTESRVSNSSKKSDYDPAKLRRSPRLSTESRKSINVPSPKKNGKLDKENKTPKKQSVVENDKPKKKSQEKTKKLLSEKNSAEDNSKEKNKNIKPFVAPKKPSIKKSAKTDKKSIEILSSNESSPVVTKEHSSSSTGSLNRSFLTQENKPKLGIRPGLSKPKKSFVTPAKLDEALAILTTPVAGLVSANLGPLSETDESD